MRIAQVAPLHESVPPRGYGGIERVVSYLTEELVRRGHQVTLFASGDSLTAAQLVAVCPRGLRWDEGRGEPLAYHFLMLEEVVRRSADFDLIHFHVDYLHFPFSRRLRCPHLTTLHWRLDDPELPALYAEYGEVPLVSVSNAQRRPLPWLNWQATIHHGIPGELHTFRGKTGDYLAFLGRIAPEKHVDRAIDIAQRAGRKLKIAAKFDKGDRDYIKDIEPLFRDPRVEYVGELNGRDKDEFLGNALALLFPIDWPEPFGLVMIEALACGTPVIAWPCGAVPEILQEGATGFLVQSVEEAAAAVERVAALNRRTCRQTFERRFTVERMAEAYLGVYRRLAQHRNSNLRLAEGTGQPRQAKGYVRGVS